MWKPKVLLLISASSQEVYIFLVSAASWGSGLFMCCLFPAPCQTQCEFNFFSFHNIQSSRDFRGNCREWPHHIVHSFLPSYWLCISSPFPVSAPHPLPLGIPWGVQLLLFLFFWVVSTSSEALVPKA